MHADDAAQKIHYASTALELIEKRQAAEKQRRPAPVAPARPTTPSTDTLRCKECGKATDIRDLKTRKNPDRSDNRWYSVEALQKDVVCKDCVAKDEGLKGQYFYWYKKTVALVEECAARAKERDNARLHDRANRVNESPAQQWNRQKRDNNRGGTSHLGPAPQGKGIGSLDSAATWEARKRKELEASYRKANPDATAKEVTAYVDEEIRKAKKAYADAQAAKAKTKAEAARKTAEAAEANAKAAKAAKEAKAGQKAAKAAAKAGKKGRGR